MGTLNTEAQIAALDKDVMAYIECYLSERISDDTMRELWLDHGQGIMLTMGLRRASLQGRLDVEGLALKA
jgi:hypothetical protein